MGDRGNIHLVNSNIYLYTHWSGTELKDQLKNALTRGKSRWDDESYLNRIIFCELIQDSVLELTGYGISNQIVDNEHDIIEVNVDKKTVKIGSKEKTFDEFIQ